MNYDEALVYVDAWVEDVSDDKLGDMSEEDVIGIAEAHYARHVGDRPS